MLENLRAWLNGNLDYQTGINLFFQLSQDEDLKNLFKRNASTYSMTRLQKELMIICKELKRQTNYNNISEPNTTAKANHLQVNLNETLAIRPNLTFHDSAITENKNQNTNPELFATCIGVANKTYKEAMNLRAVLFSMVPSELYADPNRPDLVLVRSPAALKVVELYNLASLQFDRADFVRLNGSLPWDDPVTVLQPDRIPDHLVKSKLDNIRKNYNKIKSREQTPVRVALLQKHLLQIQQLEKQWHSLK